MKSFIFENWRLILESFLVITSAVIFIIRKKPVKVVDTLKEVIVRLLPGLINAAELQGGIKGQEKLYFVLENLKSVLLGLGYSEEIIKQYLSFAMDQVEVILSTPQKKGV